MSHVLARGIAAEFDQEQIMELLGLLPEADRSYWAQAFQGKQTVDGKTFDLAIA